MADDPALIREVGEIHGEVRVLHEGLVRVSDRFDTHIGAEAEAKVAQRRYTLTTTIAASSLVLVALAFIGALINNAT